MGVPPEWKEYLMLAVGALLVVIGFSLRRSAYHHKIDRGNGEIGTDSFVESLTQHEPIPSDQPSLLDQEADTK
jgi:hypothetical protein